MSENFFKAKKEFPHTLVIIASIVLLASILTYIVPAGEYDRAEKDGRLMVVPGTYHFVEKTPVTLMELFSSIPRGMQQTAWISFLVFIVGGTFSMIENTGAIQSVLGKIMRSSKGKDWVLIPFIVFAFSLSPTFIGTMEAYLAFIPIGILFARTLGFDALVGISIVLAAGNAGLASAITGQMNFKTEVPAIFLMMFIVVGIISRYSVNRMANEFVDGAKKMDSMEKIFYMKILSLQITYL